uniref:Uncharacterized protein n=1 Tax=Plectus sambesii TaxID=2011161 RepID=A0A914WMU7_9BILA
MTLSRHLRVKVCELGPLVQEPQAARGRAAAAAPQCHRMAKLVDSSACFLARIENSFWAKEVKVCKGMAGGVFAMSAAEPLERMLEALDRRFTKRIATLKELGPHSGLHSIRAKIVVEFFTVGSLRTVKTRILTEANQLTVDVQDGTNADVNGVELNLWGSPAGATFALVQLGGCFSFSAWWQRNSFAQ